MHISLSKRTAQKIVDTVKDVCGYNINFINTNGIIFASTNTLRIGDFHEIGKKAISTKTTIEVTSDDNFYGTQKGVNIPFIYNQEVIAAIGISGEPEDVRQYAILAQKITSLILREQEIDSLNYSKKTQLNYFIRSLIEEQEISPDFFTSFLNEYHLDINSGYRILLIKLNSRYNISNLSIIENHIYKAFNQVASSLYTFNFPNEYILLLSELEYQHSFNIFTNLAHNCKDILHIGIGKECPINKQHLSYQSSIIAINSLSSKKNIAVFDDLDLEILLGSVTTDIKKTYLQKTVSKLNSQDLELLKTYFMNNMSLKETADLLFLHKNTLQYKLNRIEKITGYNPRKFIDALKLYLSIKLNE